MTRWIQIKLFDRMHILYTAVKIQHHLNNVFMTNCCWLDGYFGFNSSLRQYFSLYRTVSQRYGDREKCPNTPHAASAVGPCPTIIRISRTPRHCKFTQQQQMRKVGHAISSLPIFRKKPDFFIKVVKCFSELSMYT